jgi:hypothetical protein
VSLLPSRLPEQTLDSCPKTESGAVQRIPYVRFFKGFAAGSVADGELAAQADWPDGDDTGNHGTGSLPRFAVGTLRDGHCEAVPGRGADREVARYGCADADVGVLNRDVLFSRVAGAADTFLNFAAGLLVRFGERFRNRDGGEIRSRRPGGTG